MIYSSKPPHGFNEIEPKLKEFEVALKEEIRTARLREKKDREAGLREGHREDSEIFRASNERSRFVFELFYLKKNISKELYLWLLNEKIADRLLIAKWRKRGYERLCCLRCINRTEFMSGDNVCICRTPKGDRKNGNKKVSQDGVPLACTLCGCAGCTG
ncbi:hypothetical protein QEN19_003702 [Hanseniaspora menglaensis]